MDGEETAKRRTERDTFGGSVLRDGGGRTTPEPPGMTGTGPSRYRGAQVRRKANKGGTVERMITPHP